MPENGKDRDHESSGPEDAASTWSVLGRHTGYGLTIAASLGFFMAVGWWVDGWFGSRPLLTILGALGGGAAGFYHMWRELVIEPRKQAEDRTR